MASAEFDQTIDRLSALEIMDDAELIKEKAAIHIDKAKKWEDNKPEDYDIYFPPYQLILHCPTDAMGVGTVLEQLFPSIADALTYAFEHYTDSDVDHVFVMMASDDMRVWGVEFITLRHPFTRPEEMPAPYLRPYDA